MRKQKKNQEFSECMKIHHLKQKNKRSGCFIFSRTDVCVCVILNPNPLITLIFSIVQWIYCHFLPMNVRSDWWMNFSAKKKKKMTRWLCHTMYILSEKTIKKSTKSSDIIWIGYLFSKKKNKHTNDKPRI